MWVTIEANKQQFKVAKNESILEAALRHNITIPYGCRSGNCGNCQVVLVNGEVTYPNGSPNGISNKDKKRGCLTCQAVPVSDLVIRVPMNKVNEEGIATKVKVKTFLCTVECKKQLSHDIMAIWLRPSDDQRLVFLAGQYLHIIMSDGHKRAFSIANSPRNNELIELHIRLVQGGRFTQYVFSKLSEKMTLCVEAPLGTFILNEKSERPMLFIAGGTGFAPVKSMIEHVFHTRNKWEMIFYWGVRTKHDLYMADLPYQWIRKHTDFNYIPVLSEPDKGWDGRAGFVHEVAITDIENIIDYDVYMAGPPIMINSAVSDLGKKKLAKKHIFSDSFEYAALKKK